MFEQARNKEFFKAGEVSWNRGTSINDYVRYGKELSRRPWKCATGRNPLLPCNVGGMSPSLLTRLQWKTLRTMPF